MKISVAIPSYNRGHLIEQTIQSILAQSYPVDEIVIADDGSNDNTKEIISNINANIKYVKIKNSGPAVARKTAIELCNNEWIALCDSDDIWLPDHIKNFIEHVQIYPNVNFYFSNFKILGETQGNKFLEAPENWWEKATLTSNEDKTQHKMIPDLYNMALIFQPAFTSAYLFKHSLYTEIGGISASISRLNAEDAHLTRRLFAFAATGCSSKVAVEIRKHDENFSMDVLANFNGRIKILELLIQHNEIPQTYVSPTQLEITRAKQALFRHYVWNNRYIDAKALAREITFWKLSFKNKLRFCKALLS
jgi:glycosyltransferase involved in cell wall biosynthesis